MTTHFDGLVRAAAIDARDVPAHIDQLLGEIS